MLAKVRSSRGLYLAFNKSIATEASTKFPNTVDCRTTHSIAYRSVSPAFRSGSKLSDTLHPKQLAELGGFKSKAFSAILQLTGVQQAHLVLGTIRRFCQSADPVITEAHVPRYGRLLGTSEIMLAVVKTWAVLEATKLWNRMIAKDDAIPMGHDGYLKLWALGNPTLPAEYILLDEAQDTNQVVLAVLQAQASQIVYVGDKHQQIYEWRGAVNAMEQVQGCAEASLTQSFRFGETIASAASRVIATLGEKQQLRGNPAVKSSIGGSGLPADAVLSRTNASVIVEVLDATNAGRRPFIVGGTAELTRLLSDVYELKKKMPAMSPEFFGFADWDEVVEFADSEEGEGIRTFVQLVEQHGENKLWGAVKGVAKDERGASVILSTAHKAKGREWDSVRLSQDFVSSRQSADRAQTAAEVRLFYVAMTRAKKLLSVDPEMLTHFTTDAWKTAKPKAAVAPAIAIRRTRPSASVRREPARSYVVPEPKRPMARPRVPQPPAATAAPAKELPPVRRPSFWKRLFGG